MAGVSVYPDSYTGFYSLFTGLDGTFHSFVHIENTYT